MRSNRYITKAISVLLIVVLMQKTIGGLYLHDWLHTQNSPSGSLASHLPAIIADTGNCTCIDDFYIPFTETPGQIIPSVPDIYAGYVVENFFSIPFASKFFHSLRGPPSIII